MSSGGIVAFVRLLDEGTEVCRPVEVQMLGSTSFRVVGPQPDDEIWEFAPGDLVSLVDHTISSGERVKLIVTGDQGGSA